MVTQPTLLGAAAWDKDPKHASCANHLRFYLSEFPILRPHEKARDAFDASVGLALP